MKGLLSLLLSMLINESPRWCVCQYGGTTIGDSISVLCWPGCPVAPSSAREPLVLECGEELWPVDSIHLDHDSGSSVEGEVMMDRDGVS